MIDYFGLHFLFNTNKYVLVNVTIIFHYKLIYCIKPAKTGRDFQLSLHLLFLVDAMMSIKCHKNLFCLQKRWFSLFKSGKESRSFLIWYFCTNIIKHIMARIFGCKQCSASCCEVYPQETCENHKVFICAGGVCGVERKQLSGQGRVLLGLRSPAWGHKKHTSNAVQVPDLAENINQAKRSDHWTLY